MLHAAYATSLDPTRLAKIAPHSPPRGTGWLVGWRLTFAGADLGWDGALATIVEDRASSVFIALYDITEQDEQALDQWEGVSLGVWRKIRLRVDTLVGRQLAWLYVLDDYEGGLPSAHYLGLIADAAERGGAPADYVQDLRRRPCKAVAQ